MTVLLIGTAVIGGLLAQRSYDEHQRMVIYQAIAFAAAAYFFSYPAWFFLWKGGFLPEPMHGALFGIFYVAFILGFIYNRLKS
jgi:dolichyl-phosphate-mannose--protein O-mannosyl transferase